MKSKKFWIATASVFALFAIVLSASGQGKAAKSRNPVVVLDTTMGAIKVELYRGQGAHHNQKFPRLRQFRIL